MCIFQCRTKPHKALKLPKLRLGKNTKMNHSALNTCTFSYLRALCFKLHHPTDFYRLETIKQGHKALLQRPLIFCAKRKPLRLLSDDRLSVKEISLLCGFSDEKYFSRAFKREYGYSPSQLRDNVAEYCFVNKSCHKA